MIYYIETAIVAHSFILIFLLRILAFGMVAFLEILLIWLLIRLLKNHKKQTITMTTTKNHLKLWRKNARVKQHFMGKKTLKEMTWEFPLCAVIAMNE